MTKAIGYLLLLTLWVGTGHAVGAASVPTFHSLAAPPAELELPSRETALAGGASQSRVLRLGTFRLPRLRFRELAAGALQLVLEGARPLLAGGLPASAVIVRKVPLPPGFGGNALLVGARFEETERAVPLAPVPEPLRWRREPSPAGPAPGPGDGSRYFPGKVLETKEQEGALVVTLFPLQFDRRTGRVIALTEGELRVELHEKAGPPAPPAPAGPVALIVAPESMRGAAEKLVAFHREHYRVVSEAVVVETIVRDEAPLPETALPDGYKNIVGTESGAKVVAPFSPQTGEGYRYDVARRLAAYLRRRMGEGSRLRYVTLLGSGAKIPPSYYFAGRPGAITEYGVTDACYGAIGACDDPKLAVGRLPFDTEAELDTYLDKARRWLEAAPEAPKELGVYGGRAHPTDLYVAELASTRLLSDARAGWRGATKYFRSLGRYDRAALLDLVRGKAPHPLVYYADHGVGNQWFADDDFVTSREILDGDGAVAGVPSVIATISCALAAFDETLTREEILGPRRYGTQSVGVTLLKARSGPVAVLGSARDSIGNPVFTVDRQGNIDVTGTTYALQLLDSVFAQYGATGGGRLGDAVLGAQRAYASEQGNDLRAARHRWTLFNFTVLGDPSMPLPERRRKETVGVIARSTTAFDDAVPPRFPRFFAEPGRELLIRWESALPVRARFLQIVAADFGVDEKVLEDRRLPRGEGSLVVPSEPGRYFLRLENDDGVPVERQVWFHVGKRS